MSSVQFSVVYIFKIQILFLEYVKTDKLDVKHKLQFGFFRVLEKIPRTCSLTLSTSFTEFVCKRK